MRSDTVPARGSAAVRRVLEAEVRAARERGIVAPRVVDVGGGSGVWAVPLAVDGCQVTVVEPNPNARATLRRRADEVGAALTVVADDSDSLGAHVEPGSADLVLAHGLLEVVDDPEQVAGALRAVTAPGGALSVLVASRYAAVLHRALAGRLDEARRMLETPHGVLPGDRGTVRRRFEAAGLESLLAGCGLELALLQGDGVVADTMAARGRSEGLTGELAEFENAAAGLAPLRDIASRLHALARRPA